MVNSSVRRNIRINIRMNWLDDNYFKELTKRFHETISDIVRDLIIDGYSKFELLDQVKTDRILNNIVISPKIKKIFQINIRINKKELEMIRNLQDKMKVSNISDVVRILINISYNDIWKFID